MSQAPSTISGEQTINSTPEQRRTAWITSLFAIHEQTEQFLPKIPRPIKGQNYPEWYDRVELELAKALFPLGKIKSKPGMTPKRAGTICGRACVYTVWLLEVMAEQIKKGQAEIRSSVNEQEKQELQKSQMFAWEHGKWYSAMRDFAKYALISSVDQSYEDMSAFLLGFANGFAKKPQAPAFGALGNSNFEIHQNMMMYWEAVDRFKTVPQLHEFLVTKLGAEKVGDLKRIEKICHRAGWHRKRPRSLK